MIFPCLPLLIKRLDLRIILSFGCVVFAVSCLMNRHPSVDHAGHQFILPNVVRALGQPFPIVPITALAVAGLAPKDAGDGGSAIFNIARNLGGSVGIAILSTVVTRRGPFRNQRIGESLSPYSLATRTRLADLITVFQARGFDAATATGQAYAQLKRLLTRGANLLAFSDAFLLAGGALLLGAGLVWLSKRTRAEGDAAAH